MTYKDNRDKLNKIANTWGSTGNQELDWMNNMVNEISQRPEEIAKSEALAEHFSDPKTYRDWAHDVNNWGANVVASIPGALPNMVGGIYGWAFNKPDNWMSNSGRWLDNNVGKPLAAINPVYQAVDYLTSEKGQRQPGFWNMPDLQYSTAMQKADTHNVMGFLSDAASGAVVTGGVGAVSKIPQVQSFVKPTVDAVGTAWKGWSKFVNHLQNIAPNTFQKTSLYSKLAPKTAQNATTGLRIANKATYKGLSWGAPVIDAVHNFATKNTRFDKNQLPGIAATAGYALKLASPYQSLINIISNVPKVKDGLNSVGRSLYNQIDTNVSDLAENAGSYVGNKVVDDIESNNFSVINIPNYVHDFLRQSGYLGTALSNAAINLEEGQFNSSNIKKGLPTFLRKTPWTHIGEGAFNAFSDNINTYSTKFKQGLTVPIAERLPQLAEDYMNPDTGMLDFKYFLDKYKDTVVRPIDRDIANVANGRLSIAGNQNTVTPEQVAALRLVGAKDGQFYATTQAHKLDPKYNTQNHINNAPTTAQ